MVRLLQRLLPVNACRAPRWSQKAVLDGDVCDTDRRATVASRARRSDSSIPSARRGGHRAPTPRRPVFCTLSSQPARPVLGAATSYDCYYPPPLASALSAMQEPEVVNETVGSVVVETVDRREESSMGVQVSVMLAGIGCVVLYVVVKRWSHRRALAKAQQESEEMQRSPRHFTAEEYAQPSTPTLAAADQNPSPNPNPIQAAAVRRPQPIEAAAPRAQGPRAGRERGRRVLRA